MIKWKPGARALIQFVWVGGRTYTYQMATLVRRAWSGQWWFKLDGVAYTDRALSFCIEQWIHEPPILDRLAAL